MEQVDGHHAGGDGHVEAGAEHAEHAESRQKTGVEPGKATDPATECRADAKQGRDLAALEARAQGKRCDDQLDGCVRQGGVAGKSGAGKPRGKAGVVPGVEEGIGGQNHECAYECANEVIGDKATVQALDGSNRPGKEACRQTEDNGADNNDDNRPWCHVGNAGDDIRLVLGSQGKRRKVAGKRGDQAIDARGVVDLADKAHLHAKESSGKGRTEYGAKGRRDAGEHEVVVVVLFEVGEARDVAGDGAANLHRSSLATG